MTDQVCLRSGNIIMDVIDRSESGHFTCVWNENGAVTSQAFPISSLVRVTLSEIEAPNNVVPIAEAGKGK